MAAMERDEFFHGTFPEGFVWSTATASYQIEGAWDADGKGASIWDTFSHTPGKVLDGDTGDVACDSYRHYQQDVDLMKDMGTTHYRFSLSWPRLLPKGTADEVSPAGVAYYNRLIDALLAAGITPMVTLYHWDLPQCLQDEGGWANPKLADLFRDYARVCYREFGDRVKFWITFNETLVFVWLGYANGIHAPGIKDPLNTALKCGHTVIRAHAMAYRVYDTEFRAQQKGQCGITLCNDWAEPKDPSNPAHVAAQDRIMQFKMGWWACPIWGTGDYPQVMKDQISKKAAEIGLPESPLPKFTEEEIKNNKGTSDFFGLNHYTSRYVSPEEGSRRLDSEDGVMDALLETDPAWDRGKSEWLYVVPWGLRRLLQWIKKEYGNPPVYITENGISDEGELADTKRTDYYRRYINEALKAVRLDGCDVRGYTAWSLLDNFEWAEGYSEHFGLHHVDFSDPERKRTPKDSAKFYSQIIKQNGFPKPQ